MPTNDEHVSGVKISTFPSAQSIDSPDLVTGLKNNNGIVTNTNFTFSTILNWIRQRISEFYIPLSARGQANGVASLNESGKVPVGQIPSSNATPEMDGVGGAGSALAYARSDHQHPSDTSKISTSVIGAASGVASLGSDGKVPSAQLPTIPSASSATPQNLGTAAAGSSTDYSRADHVHNKPTAADVGAQPTITASGILKGDGQGGVSAATPGTDYQAPLTAGTDYATPAQLADKAAKADLTNIQATGTTNTTGAAIPAGAYFYLNGILHRAKTQIDQNATFTVNTNCVPDYATGNRVVLSLSSQSNYAVNSLSLFELSGMLIGYAEIRVISPATTTIGTIPSSFAPSATRGVYLFNIDGSTAVIQINSGGNVIALGGTAGKTYTGAAILPI